MLELFSSNYLCDQRSMIHQHRIEHLRYLQIYIFIVTITNIHFHRIHKVHNKFINLEDRALRLNSIKFDGEFYFIVNCIKVL
jgi:hypothetical protein